MGRSPRWPLSAAPVPSPLSLQEQLRRLYPRLKVLAFGAKPETALHTYFPSFLSRATPSCPPGMKKEVSPEWGWVWPPAPPGPPVPACQRMAGGGPGVPARTDRRAGPVLPALPAAVGAGLCHPAAELPGAPGPGCPSRGLGSPAAEAGQAGAGVRLRWVRVPVREGAGPCRARRASGQRPA